MHGKSSGAEKFERLKWEVFEQAPHRHNPGIAYYLAKEAYPGSPLSELDRLVQRVLLELLDEGLIFFYPATWDEAFTLDLRTAPRATRAEVEADLALGGDAPPKLWFAATEAGDAILSTRFMQDCRGLPADGQ